MNRHFKKYFFYVLGRFFVLLNQYEVALRYFSKAIRYRFFFLDVQERFIRAFKKTDENSFLLVRGGVGDFLQYLPFMLKNKSLRYVVVTHFSDAKFFFRYLGINVSEFYFFSSPKEVSLINKTLEKRKNLYHCPRSLFFLKNPFSLNNSKVNRNKKNYIVGMHAGASKVGLDKILPMLFVKKLAYQLINDGYKIMIFCTKEEKKLIPIKQTDKISFVSSKNIIKSLSKVDSCDYFIGSDSVFKTMSSMLGIPTLVILPIKKINSFRDRMFLEPYINKGKMYVYTLDGINSYQINKALSFIRNLLNPAFNS